MMTEAEFLEREQELLKVTPLGEVKDSDLAKLTPSNPISATGQRCGSPQRSSRRLMLPSQLNRLKVRSHKRQKRQASAVWSRRLRARKILPSVQAQRHPGPIKRRPPPPCSQCRRSRSSPQTTDRPHRSGGCGRFQPSCLSCCPVCAPPP